MIGLGRPQNAADDDETGEKERSVDVVHGGGRQRARMVATAVRPGSKVTQVMEVTGGL